MRVRAMAVACLCVFAGRVHGGAGGGTMDEFVFGKDTVRIECRGHASVGIQWNGVRIEIDPVADEARYESLPKADLVLVTHAHGDHLDPAAIAAVSTPETEIVGNGAAVDALRKGAALRNGESVVAKGVAVEAVPAYNTTPGREKFHPKGRDNGYVLRLGSARVYVAGDLEDIPELAERSGVDIAFLPVNQPYTMTPPQFARAAAMVRPDILFPYHTGETDMVAVAKALVGSEIDVRIRPMK